MIELVIGMQVGSVEKIENVLGLCTISCGWGAKWLVGILIN